MVTNKFNVSSTCLNHTKIFLKALTTKETWAVRMIDSMGKPPSGLLDFKFIWLGSWEECVNVKAIVNNSYVTSHPFKGQYCRVTYSVVGKHAGPAIEILVGMCFPSSCTTHDAVGLAQTLESLLPIQLTELTAPSVTCQRPDVKYDDRAIIVLVVCSLFLVMVVLATTYDVIVVHVLTPPDGQKGFAKSGNDLTENAQSQGGHVVNDRTPLLGGDQPEVDNINDKVINNTPEYTQYKPGTLGKLLLSFSVYANAPKILGTNQPSGTLTAVNGIRFISMTWVILGHTYDFGHAIVDNAVTYIPGKETRFLFQAINNESVAVDTFFVLSGLLVSYLSLREMKKRGGMTKFKWGMFYFHRFWRLTPPYMLLLMTYASLSKYFGDGPFWPQKNGLDGDACRDTWWTNLLYINNLVKVKRLCMGWSWYLSNDMQFYVISPLMLIPLFYSSLWGSASCLVFVLVNFIAAGTMSKHYEMSANLLLPNGPGKLYDKPWFRVGPYAVGIFVGYLLYKTECKVKMPKVLDLIGWLLATTLALLILYGLYSPDNKDTLGVDVAALYNATNRTIWSACIAWVVYACATGYGGPVDKLLSWPAIIPLSRLTYCAYLVHPIVIYTYIYSHRTLMHYYDLEVVYIYLGNLCMSYAVAFVVSLVFESPMMGLEKVLLGREKNS